MYFVFHLGVKVSSLKELNKCKVAVDIANRWVKRITEYGDMTVLKAEDGVREGVIA